MGGGWRSSRSERGGDSSTIHGALQGSRSESQVKALVGTWGRSLGGDHQGCEGAPASYLKRSRSESVHPLVVS